MNRQLHPVPSHSAPRDDLRALHLAPEAEVLARLTMPPPMSAAARKAATDRAAAIVAHLRSDARPGLMEVFLAEYGLSTEEGIALMCLAEALLRVPDAETVDALIEDKIAPSEWGAHLGHSASPLVNASTWALMLTGRVLREDRSPGIATTLHHAVKRLGEPVIRAAVRRAMREMGNQFVLGETIQSAMTRARGQAARGYRHSYDMLGEAALTAADAETYFRAYAGALGAIAARATAADAVENPGLSIKLSALFPRYEETQRDRVMAELVPRLAALLRQAKAANVGISIDAEEADRLELSLDVMEAALADPDLAGWDGFGVVIQAYSRRAIAVIDWVRALAEAGDRRIMVRLVKGAYWDTEIKRAQVAGLPGFPVFTRKAATDVSYIACARKLLDARPRLYPQFATHNAHSMAAVLEMAGGTDGFEFQRLHGMGEALHDHVMETTGVASRIYAPVGAHRDLLAYLVRRLLENGANSSFVNQLLDASVPPAELASDPFDDPALGRPHPAVHDPADLFRPERANSAGIDLHDRATLDALDEARHPFRDATWSAAPMLARPAAPEGPAQPVTNPADPSDRAGRVSPATQAEVAHALDAAAPWTAPAAERARILAAAADLYEDATPELFALLAREAGKTPADALAELREAVDFLRYYAARAPEQTDPPRGLFACISPWNFPLAIFTGQIAAALAAGNGVLAKPAEQTPLIAARGVALLHAAGVPAAALQLLPGDGATVGAALTSDPRVGGVAFTGSTETAQAIHRAMAEHLAPDAPLIAETGGLNAMVVDSTALPEQAVRDILASAFQSAGQRCSALRCLYVQEDIAKPFIAMLTGAMDELRLGDPWEAATDIGPVIDDDARETIRAHIEAARAEGRLLHEIAAPKDGIFVGPTLLRVGGIEDLDREIFGPVLHVATFRAERLDAVYAAINGTGYGLTFGLHTRIDARVEEVSRAIAAGNLYVNRNQIGAVVGSQPFGGNGLSGTGPKAGGPDYVPRFCTPARGMAEPGEGAPVPLGKVQSRLDALAPAPASGDTTTLAGPTGEANLYATRPRGTVLCLGPGREAALAQAEQARATGCAALAVAPDLGPAEGLDGTCPPEHLADLARIDAVAFWGDDTAARDLRRALAARPGPILPLVTAAEIAPWCRIERHLCVDTTASGGNATLLAAAD